MTGSLLTTPQQDDVTGKLGNTTLLLDDGRVLMVVVKSRHHLGPQTGLGPEWDLQTWDLTTGRFTHEGSVESANDVQGPVRAVQLSDGRLVLDRATRRGAPAPNRDAAVYQVDRPSVAATKLGDLVECGDVIEAVALPGDRVVVLCRTSDQAASLRVFDPRTGSSTRIEIPMSAGAAAMALLADGHVLVAGGSEETELTLVDPGTGQATPAGVAETASHRSGAFPLTVGLSMTVFAGDRVLIVSGDHAGVWDPKTASVTPIAGPRRRATDRRRRSSTTAGSSCSAGHAGPRTTGLPHRWQPRSSTRRRCLAAHRAQEGVPMSSLHSTSVPIAAAGGVDGPIPIRTRHRKARWSVVVLAGALVAACSGPAEPASGTPAVPSTHPIPSVPPETGSPSDAMADRGVITVDPPVVAIDEPASHPPDRVPPASEVTVRATTVGTAYPDTSGSGVIRESSATFRTDAQGAVDLSSQAPVSGSYSIANSMGLFWSVKDLPSRVVTTTIPALAASTNPAGFLGFRYQLTAEVDGKPVATATRSDARFPGHRRARHRRGRNPSVSSTCRPGRARFGW